LNNHDFMNRRRRWEQFDGVERTLSYRDNLDVSGRRTHKLVRKKQHKFQTRRLVRAMHNGMIRHGTGYERADWKTLIIQRSTKHPELLIRS